MKITVCIPTYNRPDLLKEAIESCLMQSYPPYEIIIGDDSKNDDSLKLVDSYILNNNVKIVYQKNAPSLGQLANVNDLMKKASGDKFVLLHDDDLLLPDALESMKQVFDEFPDVQVVYGKQILINEDGSEKLEDSEKLNNYYYRTKELEGSVLSSLEAAMVQQFPNDCYMLDMEIVKRHGYGSKDEVGNAGDFDFGFRLGTAGYKFHFLNKVTAKYRVTESSVARNGTDSAYQSYKLIDAIDYKKSGEVDYRKIILSKKSPIAMLQAVNTGKLSDAFNIYKSKWHRGQILTLGGIKRLMIITSSYLKR